MVNIKSTYKIVNTFDPSRLPGSGHKTDIKIKIINQCRLHVTELDTDQQSFKLEVTEPELLGLESSADVHVNEFMRKIILACNLILKNAVFSTSFIDSSHAGVVLEHPSSTSKTEKTSTGAKNTIMDELLIRDSLSCIVGFTDELDEVKVINVLQKIHTIFDSNSKSPLKIRSLKKSLIAYDKGLQATSELHAFKGIYEAMELAVNSDGMDSRGSDFDKKVKRIMGDDTLSISLFRNFNNSTKHSGKDRDNADYETGIANINSYNRTLRTITTAIILSML